MKMKSIKENQRPNLRLNSTLSATKLNEDLIELKDHNQEILISVEELIKLTKWVNVR